MKTQNLKLKTQNHNSKIKIKNTVIPINRQPTTDNRQSIFGFTLMELLVVIAIIVVLVSIGISSFATAQKKGRDAKRKGDIKELQNSLEQYYTICGYKYPIPTNFYSQGIVCTSPSIAIMPTVVTDPRGTTPYFCGPTPGSGTCNNSVYTVCAMLEAESTGTFCISNQQ